MTRICNKNKFWDVNKIYTVWCILQKLIDEIIFYSYTCIVIVPISLPRSWLTTDEWPLASYSTCTYSAQQSSMQIARIDSNIGCLVAGYYWWWFSYWILKTCEEYSVKNVYSLILFSSWAILRGPAGTLPVHCIIYIYALKVIDPLLFSWYIPVLLGVALALGVATASNNKQQINLCAVNLCAVYVRTDISTLWSQQTYQ